MELIEFGVIAMVLGVISGVILFVFDRKNPAKKAKNSIYESIKQLNEVKDAQITEILDRNMTELRSVKASLKAKEKELASPTEEEEEEIPPELLEPIAKKLNMQPQQLSMLLQSPQVKKMLGGKLKPEMIGMILPLLGGLGQQKQDPNQVNVNEQQML